SRLARRSFSMSAALPLPLASRALMSVGQSSRDAHMTRTFKDRQKPPSDPPSLPPGGPNRRPKDFADKAYFTDDEAREYEKHYLTGPFSPRLGAGGAAREFSARRQRVQSCPGRIASFCRRGR